jgi:hypothetical protein
MNSSLQSINLRNNNITAQGAKKISDMLRVNCSLKEYQSRIYEFTINVNLSQFWILP